jgi:hypothetical protein
MAGKSETSKTSVSRLGRPAYIAPRQARGGLYRAQVIHIMAISGEPEADRFHRLPTRQRFAEFPRMDQVVKLHAFMRHEICRPSDHPSGPGHQAAGRVSPLTHVNMR